MQTLLFAQKSNKHLQNGRYIDNFELIPCVTVSTIKTHFLYMKMKSAGLQREHYWLWAVEVTINPYNMESPLAKEILIDCNI